MVSSRLMVLAGCAALAVLPQNAFGADYPDTLRPSYDCCQDNSVDDSLGFEFGLNYVYSGGQHRMTLSGGSTYSQDDTSHILEGFIKIDDYSTDTVFKARLGYSIANESRYATPATGGVTTTQTGGHVAYVDTDLAYLPWGGSYGRFGGLIGYSYKNESSSMGRVSYTTASGGDSSVNDLNIHALKIGAAGHGDYGPISVDAQASLIPYAWLTGTYGGFYQPNFGAAPVYQQGSAGAIDGALYGASGEVTLGYQAMDNVKLNLGARASYLTGDANVRFTAREVGNPGNAQDYIIKTTNLSFMRYGLFGGISGKF